MCCRTFRQVRVSRASLYSALACNARSTRLLDDLPSVEILAPGQIPSRPNPTSRRACLLWQSTPAPEAVGLEYCISDLLASEPRCRIQMWRHRCSSDGWMLCRHRRPAHTRKLQLGDDCIPPWDYVKKYLVLRIDLLLWCIGNLLAIWFWLGYSKRKEWCNIDFWIALWKRHWCWVLYTPSSSSL